MSQQTDCYGSESKHVRQMSNETTLRHIMNNKKGRTLCGSCQCCCDEKEGNINLCVDILIYMVHNLVTQVYQCFQTYLPQNSNSLCHNCPTMNIPSPFMFNFTLDVCREKMFSHNEHQCASRCWCSATQHNSQGIKPAILGNNRGFNLKLSIKCYRVPSTLVIPASYQIVSAPQ